jgi:cytosine/adenosine deaminase-related metal-dependent hydrolase
VGKAADVVLFDSTYPEWQPLYNPVSNLVYSATGGSVADVFVAGDQVLRDGRLVHVDEAEVLARVREASARISSRLGSDDFARSLWPVT